MIPLRVLQSSKDYQRTCDFCDRPYIMNNREIPRLYLIKRIDINDLTSKDMIASPDYCDVCIVYIQRFLEKKRKLMYKLNSNKNNPIVQLMNK